MGYVVLVSILSVSILTNVFLIKKITDIKNKIDDLEDIIVKNNEIYIRERALMSKHISALNKYINSNQNLSKEKSNMMEDILYSGDKTDEEKDTAMADLLKSIT